MLDGQERAFILTPEWVEQNGGAEPVSVGAFLLLVVALSPLMTWLFNHSRGSVAMAILAHASVNTALVLIPGQLFPVAGTSLMPATLAFSIVAVVLVACTRGRLGQRQTDRMRQSARPVLFTGG